MTKEQMKEIIVNNSYETETGIKSKIVGIEQNLELVEKEIITLILFVCIVWKKKWMIEIKK